MKKFSGLVFWVLGCALCTMALGQTEPRDVRLLGDSIFAGSGDFEREFENLASFDIQSHAVSGHRVAQIRDQYLRHRNPSITTVIMNGGGNDVLGSARGDCMSVNERCQEVLQGITDTLVDLWQTMREDGVDHIVYVGFYHPTSWQAGLSRAVDHGMELVIAACEEAEIHCILVDPRPAFDGRQGLITWDGIHPTWQGSRLLAELTYQAFVDHGISLD